MGYNAGGQLSGSSLTDSSLYKNESASPDSSDPTASLPRDGRPHRRGYQACQRCRERKVKCDLGSVDAPADPPCKRCLRERLKCEFAPTRKKQKKLDGTARDVSDREVSKDATPSVMNGSLPPYGLSQTTDQLASPLATANGLVRDAWSPSTSKRSLTSHPHDESLQTRSASIYGSSPAPKKDLTDVHLHSQIAAAKLHAPVSNTQDALGILVDAAFSNNNAHNPNDRAFSDRAEAKRNIFNLDHASPETLGTTGVSPEEQAERQAGLKVWSEVRFVRNGWFTAWEAMQYVEYFYEKLALMTPVVFPDYRSPFKHRDLLINEPILALAILAIASRHMPLSGHAATTRSHHIQAKLWNSLRRQVERLLWGQEQFGGGFCGGGNSARIRESETGQITWSGSLRTFGTIEALLLLTDWQPQALHFPPNDDETGLLDQNLIISCESSSYAPAPEDEPKRSRDYDNLPYASWLEPAWRSDRMSWMLLGLAQNLAFELGVFDTNHFNCRHEHGPDSECARKRRIKNLVLVYVAQTSGRMGIQSSLNVEEWETDTIWDQTQRPGQPGHPIDIMQACWLHIARILNRANREIFSSPQFTRDLTSSGRYKDSINTFTPLLRQWMNVFDQSKAYIHPIMQSILRMEYEYTRLYVNSLGLQKVVESWVEGGSNIRKTTLLKIAEDNKPYIDEVTDAALNILSIVVDDFAAKDYLRNAPVRIYLRSLSGMMFTLKRFSLGTHEALVRKCLQQLEKIIVAMSKEYVDDVHLSSSTSRLVGHIVRNVKQSLIRVQQGGTGSAGPSREQSRAQSPHAHDHDSSSHHLQQQQQQQQADHAMNVLQQSPGFYLNDPLAGIQARPMAELSSQTFVPPPNFHGSGDELDSALDETSLDPTIANFSMDWFALPLDNLWHNDGITVDQGLGGIGPTVGARDMLEVITNQDYNQMQWNGDQPFDYNHS
ncbi:zinc finger transcriptional activator [Exophiala dermatitidis]|uniref:Zinc finger transcriptional activator n=1 Tax=Exophiala dermatitidis TaxID=5970 RepID=A0AAN6IUA9_EXODE|nr:zinc finger transcriptional activator [Exophiala dermatitidis]KAJ4507222.1 zinc finger transcriptional activator [Exophiala dermatitidis]KAJ4517303.1 zinc finger transcriptional activator [Exophiala dermatitidis]KAJ4548951.1 zinc finger transcriptional activator [Exophiala dermatitidis]KAJ4550723.1 zinc finger transcriptional activator [Exophiala dermatitidis]